MIFEIIAIWFIADSLALILSKSYRDARIDYLKRLDKKSSR